MNRGRIFAFQFSINFCMIKLMNKSWNKCSTVWIERLNIEKGRRMRQLQRWRNCKLCTVFHVFVVENENSTSLFTVNRTNFQMRVFTKLIVNFNFLHLNYMDISVSVPKSLSWLLFYPLRSRRTWTAFGADKQCMNFGYIYLHEMFGSLLECSCKYTKTFLFAST